MPCIDLAHHFRTLTARIFDRLRFIEDQQVVAVFGQLARIAPQQRIRRQDDVVRWDLGKPPFSLGAVKRKD